MEINYQILYYSSRRLRLHLPFSCTSQVQAYLNQLAQAYPGIERLQFYLDQSRLTIHYRQGALASVQDFLGSIRVASLRDCLASHDTGLRESTRGLIVDAFIKRLAFKWLVPQPLQTIWTLIKAAGYALEAGGALVRRELTMEVLDFAAIATSISQGQINSAGTIMFILGLGDQMDQWTQAKSMSALSDSLRYEVVDLWILDEAGERYLCSSQQVRIGDRIVVNEGGDIYFDGRVLQGRGMVNEGALTGEPFPVAKEASDLVYSNTVLETGELIVEVTNDQMNSRLRDLIKQIQQAELDQSGRQYRFSQRADHLVKFNFLGMALTYLLTRNFTKAMTFLLVDYSCALKLSTSVSYMTGLKTALAEGIVVKGPKFLDIYHNIDRFVFDKTGTLTTSRLLIDRVVPFGDHSYEEVLAIGACLEEHLYHPIAQSVVDKARDEGIEHEEMHGPLYHIASKGVKSSIDDRPVVIGSYTFITDEGVDLTEAQQDFIEAYSDCYNLLYLAYDGDLIAIFCINTPLRPEAQEVLNHLAQQDKQIILLTGDTWARTAQLRERIHFDDVRAEVSPQDKYEYILATQAAGQRVLMIGDGLNDSSAIAQADIGVVMAESSDIARQTSDMIFLNDDLRSLLRLEVIYDRLQLRLQRNLHWAVGINSCLIVGGLLGLLNSSALATLHNLATVMIVSRSLRLPERDS